MKKATQVKDWFQFFVLSTGNTTNKTIVADIELRKTVSTAQALKIDEEDDIFLPPTEMQNDENLAPEEMIFGYSSSKNKNQKRNSKRASVDPKAKQQSVASASKKFSTTLAAHFVVNRELKKEEKRWLRYWAQRRISLATTSDGYEPGLRDPPPKLSALKNKRKPILVLDLDQTLIDTTLRPRVPSFATCTTCTRTTTTCTSSTTTTRTSTTTKLKKGTVVYSGVHIVKVEGITYYVKLRPYLLPFLRTLNEHFELRLYTHARRVMAEAVLKLLGEEGRSFFTQVISREDVKTTKRKSLSNLLRQQNSSDDEEDGMRLSSALIVDDNAKDVWGVRKQQEETTDSKTTNLLEVRPFIYFSRGQPQQQQQQKENETTKQRCCCGVGECDESKDEELLHIFEQLMQRRIA